MSTITEIMSLIEFPADAVKFFEKLNSVIAADDGLSRRLYNLRELYFEKFNCDELTSGLSEICEKTGSHKYCVDMLFLLFCTLRLEEIYAEKGYSREFFIHNIKDLCYKANECKRVHGFYGIMNFAWQEGLFNLSRFRLGRLQYERKGMIFDYGNIKSKGDEVINIHIPSSGPLLPDEVQKSLKMAYDFFGPNLGEKLVFMCNTWMLYPETASLYPEGSNLKAFYELFDIIEQREDTTDSNKWRIFYVQTDDCKSLPRETSLQRSFYDYLNSGRHMGTGFGILVYSP